MEENTSVSQNTLEWAGWEKTFFRFSYYEIWKKENGARLLYDPKGKKIILWYNISIN